MEKGYSKSYSILLFHLGDQWPIFISLFIGGLPLYTCAHDARSPLEWLAQTKVLYWILIPSPLKVKILLTTCPFLGKFIRKYTKFTILLSDMGSPSCWSLVIQNVDNFLVLCLCLLEMMNRCSLSAQAFKINRGCRQGLCLALGRLRHLTTLPGQAFCRFDASSRGNHTESTLLYRRSHQCLFNVPVIAKAANTVQRCSSISFVSV